MEMSCTNDPDWSFETRRPGKKTRDCDWVGEKDGKKRDERCIAESTNGEDKIVTAIVACPEFCVDACMPTASPSLSPSVMAPESPSASAVPSTSASPTTECKNNPDWFFETKLGENI
jgi:hypothetical protein